jgi:hypothetical protein
MKPETRERLARRFASEIEALEGLLGRTFEVLKE